MLILLHTEPSVRFVMLSAVFENIKWKDSLISLLKSMLTSDPCKNTPCKNNGKCSSKNGQFECKCTSQYSGSRCEREKNPCNFALCLNGGSCVPSADFTNFTCSCPKGFKGIVCETKIGENLALAKSKKV